MNPDAVIHALLDLYADDQATGRLRSTEDYQREFPGFEELVARELMGLERDGETLPVSTPRERPKGVPAMISHYSILDVVGCGGQGTVYRALDTHLQRTVALKVLNVRLTDPAAEQDLRRFQREASLATKVHDPGLCPIYDAGTSDGVSYIVMRFVDGETLAKRLQDLAARAASGSKPLSNHQARAHVDRVVGLFEKIARSVHVLHKAGIVHRDIKPANIMVTHEDAPIVMDLGLARDMKDAGPELTHSGTDLGTPPYMSPEQLGAKKVKVDHTIDIWSLGVSLYEALALRRPFEAPTQQGLVQAILTRTPSSLYRRTPAVPRDLDAIVSRALEKSPAQRYRTALDLADDLRSFREHKPIKARAVGPFRRLLRMVRGNPATAAILAAIVISLVGVGVAFHFREINAQAATGERVATRVRRTQAATEALQRNDVANAEKELSELPDLWEVGNARTRLHLEVDVWARLTAPCNRIALAADGSWALLISTSGGIGPLVLDLRDRNAMPRPIKLGCGHSRLCAADVAPDGDLFAVGCGTCNTVEIWRRSSDAGLIRLTDASALHTTPRVSAIAFRPRTNDIVIGGADGLTVWSLVRDTDDRITATSTARIPRQKAVDSEADDGDQNVVVCSPDGRWLAVGGHGSSRVKLIDLGGIGKPVVQWLDGHTYHVTALAFNPGGQFLISGGEDGAVNVWETATWLSANPQTRPLRNVSTSGSKIESVATADDSSGFFTWIAFSTNDASLSTVPLALPPYKGFRPWRDLRVQRGVTRRIDDLAMTIDGTIVATSGDGQVTIWHPATEDVAQLRMHRSGVLVAQPFFDGRFLLSCSGAGGGGDPRQIVLWDTTSCRAIEVRSLASQHSIVGLTPIGERRPSGAQWFAAAINNDSDPGAACLALIEVQCAQTPGTATNEAGARIDSCNVQALPSRARGTCIASSAAGDVVVIGGSEGEIVIWRVNSGAFAVDADRREPITSTVAPKRAACRINAISFLDHSSRFVAIATGPIDSQSSGQTSTIELWDIDAPTRPYEVHDDHRGAVTDIALGPEGRTLASASLDGTVLLWNVVRRDGRPTITRNGAALAALGSEVMSVAFHSTEPRLFAGCRDGSIRICDVEHRNVVSTLHGHRNGVVDLAFDQRHQRLFSAANGSDASDNTVRVWDRHPPDRAERGRARVEVIRRELSEQRK